jgi:hypothetical protein
MSIVMNLVRKLLKANGFTALPQGAPDDEYEGWEHTSGVSILFDENCLMVYPKGDDEPSFEGYIDALPELIAELNAKADK